MSENCKKYWLERVLVPVEMETVISEGRASVNGKIATLGDRVDASAASALMVIKLHHR